MIQLDFAVVVMALTSPILGASLAIAILSAPKFIATAITGRVDHWKK